MPFRHIPWVLGIGAGVALAVACSLEEAKPRDIRAHADAKKGVFHAAPADKAEHYCVRCHGVALAGGSAKEPSCYQCHGPRWSPAAVADERRAPPDHTVLHDRWWHHPDRATPQNACVACHGDALQGDPAQGTPSCFLCHDRLWP